MKKGFSDRIGVTKMREVLQTDGISIELRNTIWNYLSVRLLEQESGLDKVTENLCFGFFKLPIDELPYHTLDLKIWLKRKYFELEWHDVYNLLEYLLPNISNFTEGYLTESDFIEVLNQLFEKENSGFRFIDGILSQITNEQEKESIEESISKAETKELYGTAKHLKTAVEYLSKKPKADYRNSIKESISAIESLVKQITGEKGGGLDKSLAILDEKVTFHKAFKQGLLKLYGYASDEGGIRHAILEEKDIGFDEAKFMLVSCSALVNFLIAKAEKAGLLKINTSN